MSKDFRGASDWSGLSQIYWMWVPCMRASVRECSSAIVCYVVPREI